MSASAYQPFVPLRRPGGRPPVAPRYRVVVHRKYLAAWERLAADLGEESVQQCWDHLATDPGAPPPINSTTYLRGRQYGPTGPFSRVVHYRAGSALRVDYRFADEYRTAPDGDAHRVSAVVFVGRSTSGTRGVECSTSPSARRTTTS